jgi:hypothetical protein
MSYRHKTFDTHKVSKIHILLIPGQKSLKASFLPNKELHTGAVMLSEDKEDFLYLL